MHERGRLPYAEAYAGFRLDEVEARLHGSRSAGLNACVECCDRHVGAGGIALEWENAAGERESYTFAALQGLSARFAGMLTAEGIGPGDVVAGLLPRIPDLVVTILGTWRAGAVYQPLFTAFGPSAIEHRLQTSGARLVVTDAANRGKLDGLTAAPRIAVARGGARPGDLDLTAELARHPASFAPVMRAPGDLMMLMSTSGTTGTPKGVPVPLKALLAFEVYMRTAIDMRPSDRFWNIADPGWAYGLYYTITGPLLLGHATTLYDGPFSVNSTWRIIRSHAITNLAGAPTAYRLMIAAGAGAAAGLAGQLRAVSSAGEPLNPEVIRWFAEHLGVPIHDHYGQTELGMVVNNHHGLDHPVRPGAAGVPMPGYRVVVLGPEGEELPPGVPGVLAVDMANSPLLWFPGYLGQPEKSIVNGYYLTGDTVELEPSGHISFVGRNDDVITSAGYRIGPFEVESALIEHPAVAESAVIGKPDPERTEIVKAFVVLKAGHAASDDLAEALAQHVKRRLSAHAYPREVVFVTELPKTPSGKIQRFLLRNAEKGVGKT